MPQITLVVMQPIVMAVVMAQIKNLCEATGIRMIFISVTAMLEFEWNVSSFTSSVTLENISSLNNFLRDYNQ